MLWALFLGGLASLIVPNIIVLDYSKERLFRDPESLPASNTALVLGTSQYLRSGAENPFFAGRVEGAWQLYQSRKVEKIIVSGSNPSPYYDEPAALEAALLAKGVPDFVIIRDPKGDDTYQSVRRSLEFESQDSIIIVTQKFHASRAVYIAGALGSHALALAMPDVPGISGLSVGMREFFARVKAVYQLLFASWGFGPGS